MIRPHGSGRASSREQMRPREKVIAVAWGGGVEVGSQVGRRLITPLLARRACPFQGNPTVQISGLLLAFPRNHPKKTKRRARGFKKPSLPEPSAQGTRSTPSMAIFLVLGFLVALYSTLVPSSGLFLLSLEGSFKINYQERAPFFSSTEPLQVPVEVCGQRI